MDHEISSLITEGKMALAWDLLLQTMSTVFRQHAVHKRSNRAPIGMRVLEAITVRDQLAQHLGQVRDQHSHAIGAVSVTRAIFQVWRAWGLYHSQEKRTRREMRKNAKEWETHILDRIHEAEQANDARTLWRFVKILTGGGTGANRPVFWRAPAAGHVSTVATWSSFLQDRFHVTPLNTRDEGVSQPPPVPHGMESVDFASTVDLLTCQKRYKQVASWSVPVEAWLTTVLQLQERGTKGLRCLLAHSLHTQWIPWQLSTGELCAIPKPPRLGVTGPEAERTLFLLDPWNKGLSVATLPGLPPPSFAAQYGGVKGRTRELAVMACQALMSRLEAAGIPYVQDLLDIRQAYPTISHAAVFQTLRQHAPSDPRIEWIIALHSQARLFVRDQHDTQQSFRLTEGTQQGGVAGPAVYRAATDCMNQEIAVALREASLTKYTQLTWHNQREDAGASVFVDDQARIWAAPPGRLLRVVEEGGEMYRTLMHARWNQCLEPSKRVQLARHVGTGSRAWLQRHKVRFPCSKHQGKYLGQMHTHARSSVPEVTRRLHASRGAYRAYAKFFNRRDLGWPRKVSVFRGVVLSKLFSGMHALNISEAQITRLTKEVFKLGRRLMTANGRISPESHLSHGQVFSEFHWPTTKALLMARRLVMVAKHARDEPQGHFFRCLLGTTFWATQPQIRPDGTAQPKAALMLKQLLGEFEFLRQLMGRNIMTRQECLDPTGYWASYADFKSTELAWQLESFLPPEERHGAPRVLAKGAFFCPVCGVPFDTAQGYSLHSRRSAEHRRRLARLQL